MFETLAGLMPICPFKEYRYIGFGSLWFVDFILAHKTLSIDDMISIESNPDIAGRADFNKPYRCISVREGECNGVLHELYEIDHEEKRNLAWLDYDGSLSESILDDLEILCRMSMSGSVLIVTLNANKNNLPKIDDDGQQIHGLQGRLLAAVGKFKNLVPTGTNFKIEPYRKFLASLLLDHMESLIRFTGQKCLPLFNISYADGAPMVTVGVIIADEKLFEAVQSKLNQPSPLGPMDRNTQVSIGVPMLTWKEKMELDKMMPSSHEIPAADLRFPIDEDKIEDYRRFYKHFPIYGEITI